MRSWWSCWLAIGTLVGCHGVDRQGRPVSGPEVQVTKHYRADELAGKRVVFVPLAVSDALGNERTGIMLSDKTRAVASAGACQEVAESWRSGTLVCVREKEGTRAPELLELEGLFAKDAPIPERVWVNLRQKSSAQYALLFRPESVSSSHEVRETLEGTSTPVIGGQVLPTTALVSVLVFSATARPVHVSDTELSYTVSASLVDLHTGQVLKVGVHSGSDSRSEERQLGFAEAPPAAPILEKIMVSLGEEVLD